MLSLSFSGGKPGQKAKEVLEEVGMSERLHHKPEQLSIGQQQRVAVARALVNSPKIVLADEPTGSLDPELADQAMNSIKSLCDKHNTALIWVSHNPEQSQSFDLQVDLKELSKREV